MMTNDDFQTITVGEMQERFQNFNLYIQSFKLGRVGDDELFGKLRINVSQCLNAQAKLGRRPLRSSVAAGTSS